MVSDLDLLLRAIGEQIDVGAIQARWEEMIKLGYALNRFESELARIEFRKLNASNAAVSIEVGDLTYQGRLGYCIAEGTAERAGKQKITVLPLDSGKSSGKQLVARSVNPIRGLLENDELRGRLFGDEEFARSIESLLRRLRGGCSAS
jgi:hypothetical protein